MSLYDASNELKVVCLQASVIDEEESTEVQSEMPSSVEVQSLCLHEKVKKLNSHDSIIHYPPITSVVEERCLEAERHIVQVTSL